MKFLAFIIILISFHINSIAQFKKGHYYTKSGKKVEGLLRLNMGGQLFEDKSDGVCSISYKASKKDKKIHLTTNDIRCFVIEQDSFAIVKNLTLSALVSYPQDFVQVLDAGEINFYTYHYLITTASPGPNGINTVSSTRASKWFIEKDGELIKFTNKFFRKQLPEIINDYPQLSELVKNGTLKYKQSVDIIKMYNEYKKSL